jgi:hypothetical protein
MLQQKGGIEIDYEGLGGLKRALGSYGSDIPALLDQLYNASLRSGVGINSMIGALSSAAPLMKQMGLDSKESAVLLTQFDEAGVDIGKVMPSMNKIFKESAKEGQPFNSFVKEQVEALQKLIDTGQTAAADKLAEKLFGPRGAASVLTAAENHKLNPEEWDKPEGDKTILGQTKATETMGDKWKLLTNGLETLLKPYSETLMRNVAGWFGQAAKFFQEHGPAMVKMIAGHFKAIRHAADNVGHALGNFWHACENVWHALTNVWHACENVWHAAENVWHACENVWHAFENVWHAITNVWHAFENVGHAIGATVTAFVELPNKVVTFFSVLPDKIGGFFSTAADKVAQFFSGAVDKIVGFFSSLPDKIGNIISGAFSGIHIPGFAGGGALNAPGPNGRDSALFWGANNEHVLTSDDVNAAGGHAGVYAWRNSLHRDGGGPIGPDVAVARGFAGTKYSQGSRYDCSGMVGRVIEGALHTGGPLPTTKNMGSWLTKLGFKSGSGGPGSIRVGWYDNGGGPNSGHAAMTLSDGENAESGGKNNVFTLGPGAAGADNPEFNNHMFLPASSLYGEGVGGDGSGGAFGGASGGIGGSSGGMPAGATAGVGPNGEQGYFTQDAGKVDKAQDKLNRTQDQLKDLEDKRDHAKKALSADDKKDLDDKITAKNHELDQAKKQLSEAQQGDFHKGGDSKGGEKGDKGDTDLSQLGDIFSKGLTETFLPPGFINPFDTPLAKSGGAALNYLGGLLGKFSPQGGAGLGLAGNLMTGNGSGAMKSMRGVMGFTPQPFTAHAASPNAESTGAFGEPGGSKLPQPQAPGIAQLAGFAGGAPGSPGAAGNGGGNTYNYGPSYNNSTIGHDPQQHQQAVRNDQNASKRMNVSTQRMGFV